MKRLRAVIVLMCAALALRAADAPKVFPYAYDLHDLPNGLRLIAVQTSFPNVVSLYIVIQVGSRNEVEPGKSGFAHLFEHMMFRGTKRFPPAKYEAVLKEAGAASNAYTSDDLTVYHATFSKEDLEPILDMEADRFQNLEYTQAQFRTEALAVLGEYNKNSSSPMQKLNEVYRDASFTRHTYKHTTMGFLKDIKDMPNQYEYSRQFFDRYYRPEFATILVVGDVQTAGVRNLVEKYWGSWQRGSFQPRIPEEPPPAGPRDAEISWPSPTLPWVLVAYRGSAYSDTDQDQAALDIISFIGFSESSELYKKLVITEQKVDLFGADNPDRIDPYLFSVVARVKNPRDIEYVRDAILEEFRTFLDQPVPADRLEAVKSHLRYQFALSLNSSEAIAARLARYVGLRRTPETINQLYEIYRQLTPEDIREVARKYFVDRGRTIVTLHGGIGK
ncbi:MAG: insulinase family protein [Bryobacteraceae bacterium]|nr:insulinase family protein [Bryobacteraceae bacterium]